MLYRQPDLPHGTHSHADQDAQTDLYGDVDTYQHADSDRYAASDQHLDTHATGNEYTHRLYGNANV